MSIEITSRVYLFVKPVLFLLPPEVAHEFTIWALEHDLVAPSETREKVAWTGRWLWRLLIGGII
jgi:hypothetical protein